MSVVKGEALMNGTLCLVNGELVFCPAPGQEDAKKELRGLGESFLVSSGRGSVHHHRHPQPPTATAKAYPLPGFNVKKEHENVSRFTRRYGNIPLNSEPLNRHPVYRNMPLNFEPLGHPVGRNVALNFKPLGRHPLDRGRGRADAVKTIDRSIGFGLIRKRLEEWESVKPQRSSTSSGKRGFDKSFVDSLFAEEAGSSKNDDYIRGAPFVKSDVIRQRFSTSGNKSFVDSLFEEEAGSSKNDDYIRGAPFVKSDGSCVRYAVCSENGGEFPYCKRISDEQAEKIRNHQPFRPPFREVRLTMTLGGEETEGTGLVDRRTYLYSPFLQDYLKQLVLDEQADKEEEGKFGHGCDEHQNRDITEEVLNLLIERLNDQALARAEIRLAERNNPWKYDAAWLFENVRCCRVCGVAFTITNRSMINHVKRHLVKDYKPYYNDRQKRPCPKCRQMRLCPEDCKCVLKGRRQNEGIVLRCPGKVWELILEANPSLVHRTRTDVLRDYEVMNMIITVDMSKKQKDNRFSCPICGMTFFLRMCAKVHMRRHAGTIRVPCNDCGKLVEDRPSIKKKHRKVCGGKPEQPEIELVDEAMDSEEEEGEERVESFSSSDNLSQSSKTRPKTEETCRDLISIINQLVNGKHMPCGYASTVAEYCPEKAWTIVDMRRREELRKRQTDRKTQLRILELMTESRVNALLHEVSQTRAERRRLGVMFLCRFCQILIRGRLKHIVHILAHAGIWIHFCTICNGRPKFLSATNKHDHDLNMKHRSREKMEEGTKEMAGVEETEDMPEDAQEAVNAYDAQEAGDSSLDSASVEQEVAREPCRRRRGRKKGCGKGYSSWVNVYRNQLKKERVYTEDASMVKRIIICPEKVLEVLQVIACGGKPDWSNMPKAPWAVKQRNRGIMRIPGSEEEIKCELKPE